MDVPHNTYEGPEPYIFVSYAHKDSELVYPVIRGLQERGFRVWYDAGIEVGSEWPEFIAEHLAACTCFLAFISRNSLNSTNCRQEINYAIDLNKEPVAAYLEDVNLSPGMQMRLGAIQAVFYPRFPDVDAFVNALTKASIMQPCRGAAEPENKPEPEKKPEPEVKPKPEKKQKPPRKPRQKRAPTGGNVFQKLGAFGKRHKKLLLIILAVLVLAVVSGLLVNSLILVPRDVVECVGRWGWEYRIGSITFLDTLDDKPLLSWDVSENWGSGTYGWAKKNGALYDVYIAAEGGVIAPEDASNLFIGYKYMHSLDCRGLDTSNVAYMYGMFSDCESLVNLDISSFDTSNVTNMALMFCDCRSLTELDVRHFETSGVTDMSAMFAYCWNLESLDLGSFVTADVANMSNMFRSCMKLREVNLSSFNTANVTDMHNMFYDCDELTALDLNHFETSKVTDMSSMFWGCDGLTDLRISGWDLSSVENYEKFMADGALIAGEPWENLFP